jgi:hypothetical protein
MRKGAPFWHWMERSKNGRFREVYVSAADSGSCKAAKQWYGKMPLIKAQIGQII